MKRDDLADYYHNKFFYLPRVGAALIRRYTKLGWDICIEISTAIRDIRKKEGIKEEKIWSGYERPLKRLSPPETPEQKIKRIKWYSINYKKWKHMIAELSEKEINEIQEFYLNCPPGYQVDHIIPISRGGKHHVSNFQYLTPSDNARKNAYMGFMKEKTIG